MDEDAGRRGPAIVGREGSQDLVGCQQRMMILGTFVSFESHDTVRRAPRAGRSTGLPPIFPDLMDSVNTGIKDAHRSCIGDHRWIAKGKVLVLRSLKDLKGWCGIEGASDD
jgi:hypothetical protein